LFQGKSTTTDKRGVFNLEMELWKDKISKFSVGIF
jgi:hypothetical protein